MQLARLNVDIKDFQPAGVPQLHGGAAPWVCMGKHLCGAATDFTLRCCATSLHAMQSSSELNQSADHRQPEADSGLRQSAAPNADNASHHHHTSARNSAMQTTAAAATTGIPGHANGTTVNKVLAATATGTNSHADRDSSGASQSAVEQAGSQSDGHACTSRQGLQGLAVATCCHHRCSWQHYVGKASFKELGFSPEDFEVMSWMTGTAVMRATIMLCSTTQSSFHCIPIALSLQAWPCYVG